jgi:hypothetical protein
MTLLAKEHRVQRRQQRRALATGGDVGTAKVCNHVDPAAFGNDRRVAKLQCERVFARGAVSHGLSVRADRAHGMGCCAALLEYLQGGIGKAVRNLDIESPEGIKVECSLTLCQGQDLVADPGGPRMTEAGAHFRPAVIKVDQGRVDAVDAGTRDQAEIKRCEITVTRHQGVPALNRWCRRERRRPVTV